MVANRVSGSFRGIEISFIYDGPHVVMSVLNTTEEGKRLRVMFQQQPRSGRVNWTTFQLTGQTQDVVVPPEVMQSHKLAFYVDNHEPIATYTDKIIEELNQIPEKSIMENPPNVSEPELDQQAPLHTKDEEQNALIDTLYSGNDSPDFQEENINNPTTDVKSDRTNYQHIPNETDVVPPDSKADGTKENDIGEEKTDSSLLIPNKNAAEIKSGSHGKTQEDLEDQSSSQVKIDISSIGKHKTNRRSSQVPDVNTELKFKIKVPSLPKSASKKQTAVIPTQSGAFSTTKQQRQGFFGNLAGAFGLSFANKKQFYLEQNKHLHEKFHSVLEKMENDYNNGNGISLESWDIEALNEQETAVLLLNLMVNEMSEWKKDAQKVNSTKETLAKTLEEIENELKQTLKHTRGINAPSPTLFPDRSASSEQDLERIQKDCDSYLQRFSEKLSTLEHKHAEKVRVSAFKKFLLEFIRDRLFPAVVEFSSLKSVQSRLSWFLDLVDYELMPIEPGRTKFSPELHELKDVCSSDFDPDTIVEVVAPGLQLKGGERIVQNAVVIQAE